VPDGLDVYNLQLGIDLDGRVDPASLRAAVTALLRRHPNLRAGFWHDGLRRPVQVIPGERAIDYWVNACYENGSHDDVDVFFHDVPPVLAAQTRRAERDQAETPMHEP